MNKSIGSLTLRERFERRHISVTKYARAYGVDHAILSKVLDGKLNGSKGHRGGSTRKIIVQLKVDKIWIGKFPWDKPPAKEEK